VGGGESTLVDDLLAHEFRNITVLDVPESAIEATKNRLRKSSTLGMIEPCFISSLLRNGGRRMSAKSPFG
jgi:hypothetical protein